MEEHHLKTSFNNSLNEWVLESYSVRISFISIIKDTSMHIIEASIVLSPLPAEVDNSFFIKTDVIYIGQIELNQVSKKKLIKILQGSLAGVIETANGNIELPKINNFKYFSNGMNRDTWYHEQHLRISENYDANLPIEKLIEIDNSLRKSNPPFDGLQEAILWLGLNADATNRHPTIDITIRPPIDLIFDESLLSNNQLKITLHAHPSFDSKFLQIAVKEFPGEGLKSRYHIASKIKWNKVKNNRRAGTVKIQTKNADNVLIIVMIGNSVVRRHWFIDPAKARNERYLSVQNFDNDLKMIRNAVFDNTDSSKFENGIAALFFLLGLAPIVQLESNSPDIILHSPKGRIILVECTLKTSDFSSKIGKLVDRRGSLEKELLKSGHSTNIFSILVCRSPRDQIAAHENELKDHRIILFSHSDLLTAFETARYYNDPDKFLDEIITNIRS